MCGRAYSTYTDDEIRFRYLGDKKVKIPAFKPNYNLSPTQTALVVRVVDDKPKLDLFRWGLIPFWAKDVKSASKYSLINARGEEILEKRSYAQCFQKRRCIVPLSGFIEWKREGDHKRPFAIHLKDEPILSMAGVWEHWENKENGEVVESFSVITTSANKFMEKIHDRMPVILDKKDEAAWLDPENQDASKLVKFLKPCPSKWLEAYEIGTAINSPRNNSKELLKPLTGEILEG